MKTHIHVISSNIKKNEWGEVLLDGKMILPNNASKRGINLLVLNMDFKVIAWRYYDFGQYDLNETFIKEMKTIPSNNIVILFVKGDGIKKINAECRQFLKEELKSAHIQNIRKHQAWCYVGIKYDNHFKHIVERYEEVRAIINGFYSLRVKPGLKPAPKNVPYFYKPQLALISPIKAKTAELKHKLKSLKEYDMSERLKILHNQYKGATCYIISCGPSVNKYSPELIRRLAGHNLVFSIKQAFNKFMDITDFHLYNFCNLYAYNYPKKHNIITAYMSQKDIRGRDTDLNFMLDQEYQINAIRSQERKYPPLSKLMNFERYTMDKIVNRPEGPGIMYELGIYLAVHLGVSEIVTIGWDLSYSAPKVVQTPTGKAVEKLDKSHFYGSNPHTQKNIEKIVNENAFIIKSSRVLNAWLKLRKIDLFLLGNLSKLDVSIPRIDAKRIFNEIQTKDKQNKENEQETQENEQDKENKENKQNNQDFMEYKHFDSIKSILPKVQINVKDVDNFLKKKKDDTK